MMQKHLGQNIVQSNDFKSPQVLICTVHGNDAKWTVLVLSGQNPAL